MWGTEGGRVLGQGVLEMLFWEAGRSLPGLGSPETGTREKAACFDKNKLCFPLSQQWQTEQVNIPLFCGVSWVPGGGQATSLRDGTAHASTYVLQEEVCI